MDGDRRRPVDVICQHSQDGRLVPLKVRVRDEEGEYQAFRIKSYKDLSFKGAWSLPDGVYVSNRTLVFECIITVFGRNRMIRLYYDLNGTVWRMSF